MNTNLETNFLTYSILLEGRTQGVGLRSFIRNLAVEMNLTGEIYNSGQGVVINLTASRSKLGLLLDKISKEGPAHAQVLKTTVSRIDPKEFDDFSIADSKVDNETYSLSIAPDRAVCKSCLSDTFDKKRRRYLYGFNSCLECGPRYSIVHALPYDRSNTSMAQMGICEGCQEEYNDSVGKRQHAQSLSCYKCEIKLHLWKGKEKIQTSSNEIIDHIGEALRSNQIVAIKGFSGYLFCCNALLSDEVDRLRKIKNRPKKPLALMYKSIEAIIKEYHVSDEEEELLESAVAPIVLLKPKKINLPNNITYGLDKVGVMLASTPLLQIIADNLSFPIVATSGNISSVPVTFEDKEMVDMLGNAVDSIVSYDRTIVMPQDDSVVRLSPKFKQKIILRRGRGLAPELLAELPQVPDNILAFGADLKNTIAYYSNQQILVSQYIGDAQYLETQTRAEYIYQHYIRLAQNRPSVILADLHPAYYSRRNAMDYSLKNQIPIKYIRHHEAHFAAILTEHDLWKTTDKILGVIWDGSGYHSDTLTMGGEFYLFGGKKELEHVFHFEEFDLIAGDKMSKEPRLAALSFFKDIKKSEDVLREKFTRSEWQVYSNLVPAMTTSSVGRLFDAVASLLCIIDVQKYEGQAAMLLEKLAREYQPIGDESQYAFELNQTGEIHTRLMLGNIYQDFIAAVDVKLIAYRFHLTLAKIIVEVAESTGSGHICCSGGVFQNTVLVDLLYEVADKDFTLYFHEQMSPNDENISLGQIAHYLHIDRHPE